MVAEIHFVSIILVIIYSIKLTVAQQHRSTVGKRMCTNSSLADCYLLSIWQYISSATLAVHKLEKRVLYIYKSTIQEDSKSFGNSL